MIQPSQHAFPFRRLSRSSLELLANQLDATNKANHYKIIEQKSTSSKRSIFGLIIFYLVYIAPQGIQAELVSVKKLLCYDALPSSVRLKISSPQLQYFDFPTSKVFTFPVTDMPLFPHHYESNSKKIVSKADTFSSLWNLAETVLSHPGSVSVRGAHDQVLLDSVKCSPASKNKVCPINAKADKTSKNEAPIIQHSPEHDPRMHSPFSTEPSCDLNLDEVAESDFDFFSDGPITASAPLTPATSVDLLGSSLSIVGPPTTDSTAVFSPEAHVTSMYNSPAFYSSPGKASHSPVISNKSISSAMIVDDLEPPQVFMHSKIALPSVADPFQIEAKVMDTHILLTGTEEQIETCPSAWQPFRIQNMEFDESKSIYGPGKKWCYSPSDSTNSNEILPIRYSSDAGSSGSQVIGDVANPKSLINLSDSIDLYFDDIKHIPERERPSRLLKSLCFGSDWTTFLSNVSIRKALCIAVDQICSQDKIYHKEELEIDAISSSHINQQIHKIASPLFPTLRVEMLTLLDYYEIKGSIFLTTRNYRRRSGLWNTANKKEEANIRPHP